MSNRELLVVIVDRSNIPNTQFSASCMNNTAYLQLARTSQIQAENASVLVNNVPPRYMQTSSSSLARPILHI